MEQLNNLIIDDCGKEYEFKGGGGGQPGHDSVGSEQIINESVEMEDLHKNVKDKMVTDDDRVTAEELANFEV